MKSVASVRQLPGTVMTDLAVMLSAWQTIDPPERLIIVGAGRGTGPWAQAARKWAVPEVWLIEADAASVTALERGASEWPGCHVVNAVLAQTEGEQPFHTASLAAESGLVDSTHLRSLYPQLVSRTVELRTTTTLDALLSTALPRRAWLVIDCTGAEAVLAGAQAVLDSVDLVVVRRYDGLTPDTATSAMLERGYQLRCAAPALHPGIVHAAFVRDHRQQAEHLRRAWAQHERDCQAVTYQFNVVQETQRAQLDAMVAQRDAARHEVEVAHALVATLRSQSEVDARQHAAVRDELTLALARASSAEASLAELSCVADQHQADAQQRAAEQAEAHAALVAELNAVRAAQTDAERASAAIAQQLVAERATLAQWRAQHDEGQVQRARLEAACATAEKASIALQQQLDVAEQMRSALHAAHDTVCERLAVSEAVRVAADDEVVMLRQQWQSEQATVAALLANVEALQARATAAEAQLAALKTQAEDVSRDLVAARKAGLDGERVQSELLAQLSSASIELNSRPALRIRHGEVSAALAATPAVVAPELFSFWGGGPLSPFEWLCLKSFADFGYRVTLYSFDRELAVPTGIRLGDARDILAEDLLGRIRHDAGSIYAPFSDYFRYAGIQKTGMVWIDTDVLCLSSQMRFRDGYILCGEDAQWISAGVIGLPQDSPCIEALVERCAAAIDVPGLPWGSFGPKLLTPMLQKDPRHKVLERFHFYPVHWRKTSQLFLPAEREGVQRDACGSWGIHLWNEVITRSGYHKRLCPPVGSYLHSKIDEHGVLDRFVDVLPEDTMVRHASRFR